MRNRLGGVKAHAHDERAALSRGEVVVGAFGEESVCGSAPARRGESVGIFLRVGKKKSEIIGDGFVDPLIAIAGPADDIPPPLVSDFVKGNDSSEEFLGGGVEAGALLGFGREERVSGEVKKSRPALAEGAGDLRNAEMTKWKGAGILFAEMDRGIDFTGKLL